MSKKHDYDLVVIGAGIAGFVSAVTANGIGKKVAILEKGKVGGNCTNMTCIPSKALVRLGHLSREISHLGNLGLLTSGDVSLDKTQIMNHVRSIVQKAYEKDLPETFKTIGIDVLMGHASFVDNHHVSLDGKTISSDNFMIATGTRPVIPSIPGLSEVEYLTNENLYELERLPDSLIILGGGVDGLEYASALGRTGVKCTVIEMSSRLLPMADRELVNQLIGILKADGIEILSGAKAAMVKTEADRIVVEYETGDGRNGSASAERVLVAIGRRPDLDGLEVEKAGVMADQRGVIVDRKLRTSTPNIYACGDIAGPYQLASMAEYQGITAASNMFSPLRLNTNYDNNINIIFTDPPLAFFGLTEEQAHRKYGYKLKVYRFDYSKMRRALIDGTNAGSAKFLCDGRGRLVGAHILGEAAGEVIHEAQMIRAFKKPLYRGQFITHAYPTYSQALVGRASQLAFLDKMLSNPVVRAGLWLIPGFKNRLVTARDRLAETDTDNTGPSPSTLSMLTDIDQQQPSALRLNLKPTNCGGCEIEMPDRLMNQDETPYLTLLNQVSSSFGKEVVFNFSKVTLINGLGASMLLKLFLNVKKQHKAVTVIGANDDMINIFQVTELAQRVNKLNGIETCCANDKLEMDSSEVDSAGYGSNTSTDRIHNFGSWATPVDELIADWVTPVEARKLNVIGRKAVGPVNGFGPLWQKTYSLYFDGSLASPEDAVKAMKENFPVFQPSCNKFYPSPRGISAGEVVLIDSMTPGGPVSTGVMVMYADGLSFTFVTPQGHPESGWVSFSAHREGIRTVAQICGLARAGDPVFEAAFRVAGSKMQVRIWTHVLASLAAYLGAPADISYEGRRIDSSIQWSQASNIRYNAQIFTLLREPLRWFS